MNKNYGNTLLYQKLHQRRILNNLVEAGKMPKENNLENAHPLM
jgi:hypothetical protein